MCRNTGLNRSMGGGGNACEKTRDLRPLNLAFTNPHWWNNPLPQGLTHSLKSFDPFPRWGSGSHLQNHSTAPQWSPIFQHISSWRTKYSQTTVPMPPTSCVWEAVYSATHGFNAMGWMHLPQGLTPFSELSGKAILFWSLWCKPWLERGF